MTVTVRVDQVAGVSAAWAVLDDMSVGGAAPDTYVDVTGSPRALVGDDVAYAVTYGNRGGVNATGARITVTGFTTINRFRHLFFPRFG